MTDHGADDDLPWNEAQWEAFLKQSETRAAKYGELLETFLDHPDRDEIIDREMGWDDSDDDDDADEDFASDALADEDAFDQDDDAFDDDDDADDDFDPAAILAEAAASVSDEEVEQIMAERKSSLARHAAYQRSFAFGMTVHKALKPWLRDDEPDVPIDDDIMTAFGQALVIAAKLAGAHGMGTDDDVLCGNIVCCRRGLEAAQETLVSLESLRDRGVIPADVLAPLIAEGQEVRRLIDEHIADLRSRVWWA